MSLPTNLHLAMKLLTEAKLEFPEGLGGRVKNQAFPSQSGVPSEFSLHQSPLFPLQPFFLIVQFISVISQHRLDMRVVSVQVRLVFL